MILTRLLTRPAAIRDHRQIAHLMYFEAHVHRHLDWRSPLDWLGDPSYWVLEDNGHILAVLACPQEPPRVAWIRLFAHAARVPLQEAWMALWEQARDDIACSGDVIIASIALKGWFQAVLRESGFLSHRDVLTLERRWRPHRPVAPPAGCTLRAMQFDDLPRVAEVDAAAFLPMWRNSLTALQHAYRQAAFATVLEHGGEIVGYQISTRNALGAHLARLAVRPDMQGKGAGSALVSDLIARVVRLRLPRLTVNTQSDNRASLALYHKMGFVPTGERYPVFEYPLSDG